jgi:hypothetical protein
MLSDAQINAEFLILKFVLQSSMPVSFNNNTDILVSIQGMDYTDEQSNYQIFSGGYDGI